MADWTITLAAADYDYTSSNDRKRWTINETVPAALVSGGSTTAELRNVVFFGGTADFLRLNLTGAATHRLSNAFETAGQIQFTANGETWLFQVTNATAVDTAEPYDYSFTAASAELTAFQAFMDQLGTTTGGQSAEAIFWDGEGTSPFLPNTLFSGAGTATFQTPTAATLTRTEPSVLPYSVNLPHFTRAGNSINIWRGTISNTALESDTDQSIEVTVISFADSGGADIVIAGGTDEDLLPELEQSRLNLQNADGSVTYWSGLLNDMDDPYAIVIPVADAATLNLYTGELRLLFETPLIAVAGAGTATFQTPSAAALTRTLPNTVTIAGAGTATFRTPTAATLTRAQPDAVMIAGAGSATFQAPGTAMLTTVVQPDRIMWGLQEIQDAYWNTTQVGRMYFRDIRVYGPEAT